MHRRNITILGIALLVGIFFAVTRSIHDQVSAPTASAANTSNFWVASGVGTNGLAYSTDGINWTGIGTAIFTSSQNNGVAWNGNIWVATGSGAGNTLAYSTDGINWTGLGATTFSLVGRGVAWNGSMWVAVGSGTNTIAYSVDGINWTGIGTTIFSSLGIGISWNGTMWVAVGQGTNTIAYSTDGINWTGEGASVFTSTGRDVAWNGTMWVAVGQGTNTVAYSTDGINWTGLGTSVFSGPCCTQTGRGVAWNGTMWVVVGGTASATDTIAYSTDGINWTGLGLTIFSSFGLNVAWNGSLWVATGGGTNTIAYSADGISWTGIGTAIFSTQGLGLASAPAPNLYPAIALPDAVDPALSPVSLVSDNADSTVAVAGDTISLTFTSDEALASASVVFLSGGDPIANSVTVASTSDDELDWQASYAVAASDTEGAITFVITPEDLAGNDGTTATATTDATSVTFTVPPAPTPIPSDDGASSGGGSSGPRVTTTPTPVSAPSHANPSAFGLTEGDTVSVASPDDPDVYRINQFGYKYLFLNPTVFSFYAKLGGFGTVERISPEVLAALLTSSLSRNCEAGDSQVYGVEITSEDTGVLHHINLTGPQALSQDPDFFNKVFCINTREFNWYPKGAPFNSVSEVPAYVR